MQFHIVLHQPRIPQNTGNIGRLCFASNSILHLIHPLGFSITQKELKRAGMDYWDHLKVYEWENLSSFVESNLLEIPHFYLTTKSQIPYYNAPLKRGAYLHFGREDAGLDSALLSRYQDYCYTIPMQNNARSLNLATSVGIVLYEGIRQRDFIPSPIA
ncbi:MULTISPECIES: tRNA (cytidine(34)-2'-O)-methyltransferase [Helicobacter]|uniref:tRNA (cytidine(34)-2'-O)-methyltransferase n=1 Tax=Helicobacter TaxID=209 RepID=UPI000DCBB581|nr:MULTISPECIES: tRNA (cytidine(34)-2'-O)-methyltransferase [Helicobacter]MCI2236150.1 tRNA (cytidine(34)-2'-O)-methyltransferase [Helicobacter sp. CaF467b]MCL9822374.1 tRNA (cytidine(34)-2'-O)-methyltransferase [Helicobacter colisuis]RAX53413.1 RNA methyltransferase [Helicobacter sp. 11-8110]